MTMYETQVPASVTRDQIKAACRALGIDAENVQRVCIDTDGIDIDVFLRDENGSRRLALPTGGGPAAGYLKVREHVALVKGKTDSATRADRVFYAGGAR